MEIHQSFFVIVAFNFLLLKLSECTIPYAWESDIASGNWWCSQQEANDYYPIQERHIDIHNTVHLSAHGFTSYNLCNLYFAAGEPIFVDFLERWTADDPSSALSLYGRKHTWDVWRLIWKVSMKTYRTPPTNYESYQLIRLEFRNPSRKRVDFSIVIRPESYSPDEPHAEEALEKAADDISSYYGMETPTEWEVAFIVVGSLLGICIIGVALYFLVVHLHRERTQHDF